MACRRWTAPAIRQARGGCDIYGQASVVEEQTSPRVPTRMHILPRCPMVVATWAQAPDRF
eukprot:8383640-Pyramimonas_sp.AAC.1